MPNKPRLSPADRSDPRKNKSLAIRNVLKTMPNAKAMEVAAAVKKEYGHNITQNMVYMVKTKNNMASDGSLGRPKKTRAARNDSPMNSATLWIEAIGTARQLLKSTGSLANAIAILKAVDS
jgi:hypothetical protein